MENRKIKPRAMDLLFGGGSVFYDGSVAEGVQKARDQGAFFFCCPVSAYGLCAQSFSC